MSTGHSHRTALDPYQGDLAPSIDILSPDIYRPNYKEIGAMSHTDCNPLLIPESTLNAERAYYAFARHDAICYSPFGIEYGASNVEFICTYGVLDELVMRMLRLCHIMTKIFHSFSCFPD